MKLPKYIISRPKFIDKIPVLKTSSGNTVYPFIFLRDEIYNNLTSKNPSPKYLALLYHEHTHRDQQKKYGIIRFALKYIFSKKFRFEEELAAYRISMKIYKKHSLTFNIEKTAQALSGSLYLWSTSHKEAKEKLIKTWESQN